MPRVFMIIAGVVLAILIWLFYQNSVEQKQQADLQEYETVLEENRIYFATGTGLV